MSPSSSPSDSLPFLVSGYETPPPEPLSLRAGPLTLTYDQGDLRYVRLGDRLLLLRLYAAVRDRNWSTISATLTVLEQTLAPDSFRIVYEATHRHNEIDFVWRGTLTGSPDGTLTFALDGEAHTTFERNRIGFCLLHPAETAGTLCTVAHQDGSTSEARFPEFVVPEQPVLPFAEMRALTMRFEDGLRVRLTMEGDIFEMEDQRNWTDASYKTFCTPLRLPFPVTIPAGTRIQQKITLQLESLPASEPVSASHFARHADETVLHLTSASAGVLPPIGLGLPVTAHELTPLQVERLKALALAHLRLELRLTDEAWKHTFAEGVRHARLLDVPLEMALLLPTGKQASSAFEELTALLEREKPAIARWLLLPAGERVNVAPDYEGLLRAAAPLRTALHDVTVPFVLGTSSDFPFISRFPPPASACDAFTFAINPQVHAFDNASLMETLAAQAIVMQSARRLADGLPVVVSPVTLRPRFNPYATAPLPWSPPPADPRQKTLFGAAWTLGSLKYLAESGAAAITYFETVGEGGVLDGESVFPLYHVLADGNAFRGSDVIPIGSSSPLTAIGVALQSDLHWRLLLANLTPKEQRITLNGLPETLRSVRLKSLDASSAISALHGPETYRTEIETRTIQAGTLSLTLVPHATLCLDGDERT